MRQNFVSLGGGMCILFEIREKRAFQKCMGLGGGELEHFFSVFPNPAACRSTLRCLVSWTFQPGSSRLTCTHFTAPQRALLRTKGFCGASGEATARGESLYADMVAAC